MVENIADKNLKSSFSDFIFAYTIIVESVFCFCKNNNIFLISECKFFNILRLEL